MLRRASDTQWIQRVLSNRGLLHGHRQEFAAAEADLRAAERLTGELALDLGRAFVRQNLGVVLATRGDVPAALRDEAEDLAADLGDQAPPLPDKARARQSVDERGKTVRVVKAHSAATAAGPGQLTPVPCKPQ